MNAIQTINNGETGGAVRNKMNANFALLSSASDIALIARPMRVAFAGDSIGMQWSKRNGLSPLWWATTELWPCEYTTVLDSSVGGTSSSHLISTQIAQLEALSTKPDVVIVQSLQNDFIGNTANADTYFANYQQYATRALAAGVSLVCLCARPPKSSVPDVAQAVHYLNRLIENLCRNTPGLFFVDVCSAWRKTTAADTNGIPWRGTAGAADAFSNDGTHPGVLACRQAAPLILPVLQKYARPVSQLTNTPVAYNNATYPYGNVFGIQGLMLGTNGQYNGATNANVAGNAATAYDRWSVSDNNGVIVTPSIVTGPDGYLYQRLDFSGTATADATIRLRHTWVQDVAAGQFVGEATVIASGLNVANFGLNIAGMAQCTASGSGTETMDLTGTFRLRTAPTAYSNSGFSTRDNDVLFTFKNGAVASGYALVGRVGLHRVG